MTHNHDDVQRKADEHDEELHDRDPVTDLSPSSERETETLQKHPRSSPATTDEDIDADSIKVLPGTGGPDDTGDVETDGDDETPSRER